MSGSANSRLPACALIQQHPGRREDASSPQGSKDYEPARTRIVQDLRGTGECRLVDIGLPVQHRNRWQRFLWRRSPQQWTDPEDLPSHPHVDPKSPMQCSVGKTQHVSQISITATVNRRHHQVPQALSQCRVFGNRRDKPSPLSPDSPSKGWYRAKPWASQEIRQ